METRGEAQGHTGGVGGLGKEAVDAVPVEQFQPKGHAPGPAAHPAGQVDQQGVVPVHRDTQVRQLPGRPLGRHGVAQKEGAGALVVHKVAPGVPLGLPAALGHGLAVVPGVLHHRDPLGAQQVLLPLAGVGGHVDRHPEAQGRAHNADGQAQVAGGPHRHGVLAKELPEGGVRQLGIAAGKGQSALPDPDLLRQTQDLVDPAPGLDGAGDGQAAVLLEQQLAGKGTQGRLHGRDRGQGGFDDSACGAGLREHPGDVGGEPLQPRRSVRHVRSRYRRGRQTLCRRTETGVEPEGLLHGPQVLKYHDVRLLVVL